MDKVYEISLMLDFYGQMLTDRQYEIMDLHYNNDYSFGEISEQLSISRQGVYDYIKKGKAALFEFEEKLGLVKEFYENSKLIQEIINSIKSIDRSSLSESDKIKLEKVECDLVRIKENS